MKIGVLALQGDFDAHRRRLEELGAEVVLVRKPEQFDEIDGLVIPGGESTTFLKLLGRRHFSKAQRFCAPQAYLRHLRRRDPAGKASGKSASARLRRSRYHDSPQRLRTADRFHHCRRPPARSAAIRWRWSSSARRGSNASARASKSSRNAATIPCWCGREV